MKGLNKFALEKKVKVACQVSVLSVLIVLSCLFGCTNFNTSKDTVVDVSNIQNDGIIVKNWYLLGPFLSGGKKDYLNHDNLKFFNYYESSIDFKQLKGITALSNNFKQERKLVFGIFKSKTHIVDFNEAFGIESNPSISANVYAACEIYSDREKKIRLDFTSDDGAKIWFNHELILNIDKSTSVFDYENYIDLKIKKGYNFLLVKVNNGAYNWQMIAKLQNDSPEGLEHYKNTYNRILNNNFLVNSILDTISSLELIKTIANQKRFISIFDDKSKVCYSDSLKERMSISSFKDGLYTINLYFNNTNLRQHFYKGNIIEEINAIISKLSGMSLKNGTNNSIDAYVYRFRHLLKPQNAPNSFSERQIWQTKLINIYINLHNIKDKIEKNEDPIKDVPGYHIGTFVSDIDKSVQYYLLNVPINYDKKQKYPLMVCLPVIESTNRPYLESVRMANQPVLDNLQRIADKYNICIAIPSSREVANPNLNAILETDFFETLNSIKADYNIDTTRIYLVGTCSGGYKTLELATRYPDMFAAVGLVSPVFINYVGNNDFLTLNAPINYIKNISNIPVYIIHSSVDIHTPVKSSDDFFEKAKASHMDNIQYYRSDKILDLFYWDQYSDSIVSSITKYRLDPGPRNIRFSTNQLKYDKAYWFKLTNKADSIANVEIKLSSDNTIHITSQNVNSFELNLERMPYNKNLPLKIYENDKLIFNGKPTQNILRFGKEDLHIGLRKTSTVEGPLADALIHSFIIVKGTFGRTIEKQKINDLADSINAIWKTRYFNNCRVKKDTEITKSDEENSNLILLGNSQTNSYIRKIAKSLPVKFEENGLTLRKKKYDGNKLGFYLTYPNPLNYKKYVVVIGANDITSISFGPDDMNYMDDKFDISSYGFYDYRIWDNETNEIIERGYFSQLWD